MPEPLKNLYTKELIANVAQAIKKAYKPFDVAGFTADVFARGWRGKELKDRMQHITECLHECLPQDYGKAIKILKKVAPQFSGFEYMFFPGYVETYGLEHYDISVDAMAHFTPYASSEFAVRPFIIKYPKPMMAQMKRWAKDDNHHIRRFASEGCRPRLPWAMALPEFKRDPAPVLPILKLLKRDSSEYVRRSVANNLNDISKDNPDVLIDITRQWKGKHADTDRLLKHANRSLLKQAHPEALLLFGYKDASHVSISDFSVGKSVKIGARLPFSCTLKSKKGPLSLLRLEYAIDFVKANGSQSRKVFKIGESDYSESVKVIDKDHNFKLISTRVYYPGEHALAILVNGQELAKASFTLKSN